MPPLPAGSLPAAALLSHAFLPSRCLPSAPPTIPRRSHASPQVRLALDKRSGQMYACKSISKAKLISKEDVDDVRREVGGRAAWVLAGGGRRAWGCLLGAAQQQGQRATPPFCCPCRLGCRRCRLAGGVCTWSAAASWVHLPRPARHGRPQPTPAMLRCAAPRPAGGDPQPGVAARHGGGAAPGVRGPRRGCALELRVVAQRCTSWALRLTLRV